VNYFTVIEFQTILLRIFQVLPHSCKIFHTVHFFTVIRFTSECFFIALTAFNIIFHKFLMGLDFELIGNSARGVHIGLLEQCTRWERRSPISQPPCELGLAYFNSATDIVRRGACLGAGEKRYRFSAGGRTFGRK
jgi:hypothetical protein